MYLDLLDKMDDEDFLAKCFSLGMLAKRKKVAISEVPGSVRRTEMLLSTISTTATNFGKFREILRTDSIKAYADYMDDLDSVGPDPEGQSIPNIPYVLQLCIEMLFLLDRETTQQNVIEINSSYKSGFKCTAGEFKVARKKALMVHFVNLAGVF